MVYTNAITAISGLEKTPTIAAMPPPNHGPTTGMMFSRPVITPKAAAAGDAHNGKTNTAANTDKHALDQRTLDIATHNAGTREIDDV